VDVSIDADPNSLVEGRLEEQVSHLRAYTRQFANIFEVAGDHPLKVFLDHLGRLLDVDGLLVVVADLGNPLIDITFRSLQDRLDRQVLLFDKEPRCRMGYLILGLC